MRGRPATLRDGLSAAGVAVLAVAFQLPTFDRSVVPVDEGQLVAIAARLLDGEVLYRDVYTGIFPGIYYATAGLLSLFGEDVLVTRWAQVLVNAVTCACLWLLGRRCMRPAWAWWAPALYLAVVAIGFPGLAMFNYSPLSLVLALGSLLYLLRYLESGRAADGVVTGVLLALCGLVKQNFGALGLLAILAASFQARPAGAARGWLRSLLPIALGGFATSAAAFGALAAAGALPDLLRATVLSLGESQMQAFNDPIPPVFGPHPADDPRFVFLYTPAALFNYLVRGEALFGLPISPWLRGASIRLAYGGALATLAAGFGLLWATRGDASGAARATRAMVVFALLFFLGIFPSAIWSHLAFVLAPLLLVLGAVGDRASAALAARHSGAARALAGAFAALAVAGLVVGLRISADVRRWYPEPLSLARGSLHVSPGQARLLRGAVGFLEECAALDEPVFVAPDMPILYFLAARRNPTPFDLAIPGRVSDAVMVERLRASRTRCVVYNPTMYLQFAPFAELFPELAAYLDDEFRRVAAFTGQGAEWHGLVTAGGAPGPGT